MKAAHDQGVVHRDLKPSNLALTERRPAHPPHSIEAESSVLGGLLLDNGAWDRVGDLLVDSESSSSSTPHLWRHWGAYQRIQAGGCHHGI